MEKKKPGFFIRLGRGLLRRIVTLTVLACGGFLGWSVRSWTGPTPWTHAAAERVKKTNAPAPVGVRSTGEAAVLAALRQADRPIAALLTLERAMAAGEIRDFPAIEALLKDLPLPDKGRVLRAFYDKWTLADPAGAVRHLFETGNVTECTYAAAHWATTDADALEAFLSGNERPASMRASGALYGMWEHLLHALGRRPDAAERLLPYVNYGDAKAMEGIIASSSGTPEAWLALSAQAGAPALRSAALARAVDAWMAANTGRSAAEAGAALGAGLDAREAARLAAIVKFHRSQSPEQLASALGTATRDELSSPAAAQAMVTLSNRSPAEALAVALRQPDVPVGGGVLTQLAAEAWKQGPATVSAWLRGSMDDARRTELERELARRFASAQDPAQKLAQLSTMGQEGDVLRSAVVEQAGPRKGAPLLDTLPAQMQAEGGGRIASAWAKTDARAAAEVFTSSGAAASTDVETAIQAKKIAFSLAHRDAAAAAAWVEALPAGPVRDRAVGGLVLVGARDNPESAAQWVQTIGDEGARRVAQGILDKAAQAEGGAR